MSAKAFMQILYTKADWELPGLSVAAFVERVAAAGYDGTEMYLPARPDRTEDIRACHEEAGLRIISHIATEGATPDEHLRSLEERYRRAVELGPLFVNCHTGRDHFSIADSLRMKRHLRETLHPEIIRQIHPAET